MFYIWGKMPLEITQQVKTVGPGVPQERPELVQGVPPREKSRNKKAPRWEWFKQLVPKWEPTSETIISTGYLLFR